MTSGIVSIRSNHSVDTTVEKLRAILHAKNVMLFAVIDHSGEAEKAGMHMPNTKLLIFGNPAAGTPLMLASPAMALDLPLKILVSEAESEEAQNIEGDSKVWITYSSVEYLRNRHNFPHELAGNIAVIEALAAQAAE
jgi:uncharacterized protein (DUF302 family)